MQLIGMLDSAFVRRVAITMQLLGIDYEHKSISVFSTYDRFRAINPVVKAPTLVCDDGVQLMDSTLIIDYLETLAGRSLMPSDPRQRRDELRLIGLALAACEKTVQTVHERRLRPAEKQHAPWAKRITEQLVAALEELEHTLEKSPLACGENGDQAIGQASLTVAVTWRFTQLLAPETVLPAAFPALARHSALAERLPAFIAVPPL
jgi:glutathione S-transferase